jgi:hypothetical protein
MPQVKKRLYLSIVPVPFSTIRQLAAVVETLRDNTEQSWRNGAAQPGGPGCRPAG